MNRRDFLVSVAAGAVAPALPFARVGWASPAVTMFVAPTTGIYQIRCRCVFPGKPDVVHSVDRAVMEGDTFCLEVDEEIDGIGFLESVVKVVGGAP